MTKLAPTPAMMPTLLVVRDCRGTASECLSAERRDRWKAGAGAGAGVGAGAGEIAWLGRRNCPSRQYVPIEFCTV